jgi:5-methylcytosine-specific restriction endonuclease McrA
MPDVPMRRCVRCGAGFPATTEFFHRFAQGKYGLFTMCKPCNRAHVREHNRAHPGANAERCRRYRAEHLVQCRDRDREYARTHAEERALRAKVRYAAHAEARCAVLREQRALNPAPHRAEAHRRRARRMAAEGSHTGADIEAQYARQRGRCFWCRAKVGNTYHVDHVVPLARGGSDAPENLVVACPSCNLAKHAKSPQEFAGMLF